MTGSSGGQPDQPQREEFAGSTAVLLTLSEGLQIELSDLEAENVTLKVDYLWQLVGIVSEGVPTILEIQFMCVFMSLCRILLEGSVSTNLLDLM